jgi:hypothetical protein
MIIQKYNDFVNEGVRDKMTPKSKEELKIEVDKLPDDRKLHHIEKYDLEDLYTEEEMEQFENDAPKVKEIGRWFRVTKGDDDYDVLIQGKELGSIIVLEADGLTNINNRDYMRLVPYEDWDEFEEIIENEL